MSVGLGYPSRFFCSMFLHFCESFGDVQADLIIIESIIDLIPM
jgi:hypothetical protein